MSVHYLKVKVTSLGEEIKLIRKEERRVKPTRRDRKSILRQLKSNELTAAQRSRVERKLARARARAQEMSDYTSSTFKVFWGLRGHREDLSRVAREAGLAYALLRGRTYKQVENTCRSAPRWAEVKRNLEKFGAKGVDYEQVLKDWREAE